MTGKDKESGKMKEIETKIMGILSVKKCREGLTEEEQTTFDKLNKKYRDVRGHLIKGSFFVSSDGKWVKVS